MPYKDYQNDLFGGQDNESKPKKKGFSGQRFLPYIKIPLEYTVITAVVVMLLVIIAYAIGVERGKRVIGTTAKVLISGEDILSESIMLEDLNVKLTEEGAVYLPEKKDEEVSLDISLKQTPLQENETIQEEKEEITESRAIDLYTIQLASFKDIKAVLSEIRKLKDEGISAEYIQRGEWYQVYAIGFQSIDEAKKVQAQLLSEYSDCFIRKIK